MTDPLVSLVELARRLPEVEVDAEATERAKALLEDASGLVLSVGISTWTSATVPAAVRAVLLQIVERAWANPTGLTAEQFEGYSVTYAAGGGTYLMPDEVQAVRRAAGLLGVWSLGTTRTQNDIPDTPSVVNVPGNTWEQLGTGD